MGQKINPLGEENEKEKLFLKHIAKSKENFWKGLEPFLELKELKEWLSKLPSSTRWDRKNKYWRVKPFLTLKKVLSGFSISQLESAGVLKYQHNYTDVLIRNTYDCTYKSKKAKIVMYDIERRVHVRAFFDLKKLNESDYETLS